MRGEFSFEKMSEILADAMALGGGLFLIYKATRVVNIAIGEMLMIGAYRDNEVTAANPLLRKLEAIKTAGGKVAEIRLAPLEREHLAELIADTLRCDQERAAPLAQLVHEKTGGNPFFDEQRHRFDQAMAALGVGPKEIEATPVAEAEAADNRADQLVISIPPGPLSVSFDCTLDQDLDLAADEPL